ncbi:MerR family transcriptional regulator [Chloroflexota bacterium]
MSILLNRNTFYRTSEAAKIAGISRSTLLRWIKEGVLKDASHRDRRGWRLFTKDDINRIKVEANGMDNQE